MTSEGRAGGRGQDEPIAGGAASNSLEELEKRTGKASSGGRLQPVSWVWNLSWGAGEGLFIRQCYMSKCPHPRSFLHVWPCDEFAV